MVTQCSVKIVSFEFGLKNWYNVDNYGHCRVNMNVSVLTGVSSAESD